MTLPPALNPLLGCPLLAILLQWTQAPATWFTNFVDSADEIWMEDPFLIDDDESTPSYSA